MIYYSYNVATEIYKPGKTDFPAMIPQNGAMADFLLSYNQNSETMYADWYTALKNKDYFRPSFFIFLYRAVRLQPSSAAVLLTLP